MSRKIHSNQIHYLQVTVYEAIGDFGSTLQSNNFRVDQSRDL